MVYRVSNSVAALLPLMAGCLGLIQPAANAGDKIEFSAPSALLEVPHPEAASKVDAVGALNAALSKHQDEQASESSYSPTPMVIIPAQKSGGGGFGWTAPFEDDPDQADRGDGSGLDLFAPKKAAAPTKTETLLNDKQPGISRDGNWTRFDPDLKQFGADAAQKEGDGLEDRLGGHLDDHGAADWLRSFGFHGQAVPEPMHQGALGPEKEDFGTFYQQPTGGYSQANTMAPRDPLHSSAYRGETAGNDLPDAGLRDQSEQQALMQPTLPHAWDVLPSAAHPQRTLERQQPFTAPSRAPNAPAVLAFPKRPGDLFQ
ncbi:MAG TPA: hypothetical protein VMR33_20695 [Candidatus Baltobacteraceae bacterium]|jgi:hypothetical protein|nr:hypothetical protein [Candidatus Baltobacteraceae bacterium]